MIYNSVNDDDDDDDNDDDDDFDRDDDELPIIKARNNPLHGIDRRVSEYLCTQL